MALSETQGWPAVEPPAAPPQPYRRERTDGDLKHVKKALSIVAFCGCLIASPVQAKTFVGVLWPMFGPLPAIGLVELVGELKMMPDVEVKTYLHQEWPNLVEDIARQPAGTRTAVIGYSLGANASVFVANKSHYVDLIIALQPSVFSWNPPVTGRVGKMIEVYNPNPWETFGGMGSKKLIGPNIQYIANHDSHPGAQFDGDFRALVKSEVAHLSTAAPVETAQADVPRRAQVARLEPPAHTGAAKLEQVAKLERDTKRALAPVTPAAEATRHETHGAEVAMAAAAPARSQPSQQPRLVAVADTAPQQRPHQWTAFLDTLSTSVDSGALDLPQLASPPRELTPADMIDYAKRTYERSRSGKLQASLDEGPMVVTASR